MGRRWIEVFGRLGLLITRSVVIGLVVFQWSFAESLGATAESGHFALALKFIEFINDEGKPWVEQSEVQSMLRSINEIFSRCNVSFYLGKYETIHPRLKGLSHSPQSLDEMKNFRSPFSDPHHLVIIHTAAWNHDYVGPAHAWTAMPGDSPLGVVIDGRVGKFAGIIAHELGHYLNLYHVKNDTNVMNPIIYKRSKDLTQAQCNSIRQAALAYHQSALKREGKIRKL